MGHGRDFLNMNRRTARVLLLPWLLLPLMTLKARSQSRTEKSQESAAAKSAAKSVTTEPVAGAQVQANADWTDRTLNAMTVDMAYSHGLQGIRVNAIAPGHITTPMVHSVSAPGPRAAFMDAMRSQAGLLGTPGDGWDVGWAAAFLASDEARWITGATLPVESGVLSVTPLLMAPYLRAVPEPE